MAAMEMIMYDGEVVAGKASDALNGERDATDGG